MHPFCSALKVLQRDLSFEELASYGGDEPRHGFTILDAIRRYSEVDEYLICQLCYMCVWVSPSIIAAMTTEHLDTTKLLIGLLYRYHTNHNIMTTVPILILHIAIKFPDARSYVQDHEIEHIVELLDEHKSHDTAVTSILALLSVIT